jgi:short-subunit dehydrogenase
MSGETVLITGASSGIGWELARLFAADKSNLILVARSHDRLERLAVVLRQQTGCQTRVLVSDLSDPAAPQAIYDELRRDGVQVDVLVNNAGFGAGGRFAEVPWERHLAMLQVNLTALVHLTRLFLPEMIQRRTGGVLNVGSTAAFQPGPMQAVYSATKAFVLSFSEALTEELGGTGVRVTCLCPGATATGFAAVAGMEKSLLFRSGVMDVRPVARAGYRAFRAGRPIVVPGLLNQITSFSVRFTPRWIVRKIARALLTPK